MKEPTWQNVTYGPIDYQNIIYYAAPKKRPALQSLDEVDPEIRRTFEKLGIPLHEQKTVLTRIAGETQDPEATGETCRREQNRGDEDPLSPTNPALGGGEQQ